MQNKQVHDLVNGTGIVKGYENTIYIRKDQARIDEVVSQGYELIDDGGDSSDMALYGIKYKKEEVEAEIKEDLEGEKLAEAEDKSSQHKKTVKRK